MPTIRGTLTDEAFDPSLKLMDTIYLDNNATTRVAAEVFDAMVPYLTDNYGNPSSVHQIGARAGTALKYAREKVAAHLSCRETEITFTSCATESNNAAIRGVLEATPGKRHIVTTAVEHPSVLELCRLPVLTITRPIRSCFPCFFSIRPPELG